MCGRILFEMYTFYITCNEATGQWLSPGSKFSAATMMRQSQPQCRVVGNRPILTLSNKEPFTPECAILPASRGSDTPPFLPLVNSYSPCRSQHKSLVPKLRWVLEPPRQLLRNPTTRVTPTTDSIRMSGAGSQAWAFKLNSLGGSIGQPFENH